jgi:hypothetical protein
MPVIHPAMRKRPLLPGVTTAAAPPRVLCDASKAVVEGRRRALLREAAQLVLLAAADLLFLRWPEARLPFFDRGHSLILVLMMNGVVLGDLWLARLRPRWAARRIANTWSRAERERFTVRASRGGR